MHSFLFNRGDELIKTPGQTCADADKIIGEPHPAAIFQPVEEMVFLRKSFHHFLIYRIRDTPEKDIILERGCFDFFYVPILFCYRHVF